MYLRRIRNNPNTPFIILTLSLITWLLCYSLFQDGMFIDGIQYAAIARNLARGVGSFWFPVLAQHSVAGLDTFHEHPPLVYYLQSFFFKIFGLQNIYPERIYGLAAFSATSVFMVLIWRKIFNAQPGIRSLSWLPVLLWITMPIVFWAHTNNIQENTLSVFSAASVYFFLVAMYSSSVLKSPLFYIGTLCVFAAMLCKGVPGAFTIVFFPLYWLVFRKTSFVSVFVYTVVSMLLIGVLIFILLQNSAAKESLHIWFFDRMMKRIADDPTVKNHFDILKGLYTEQLPALIICIVLLVLNSLYKVINNLHRKHFLFFLLLGLSGSLPLMLTLVQRNFYFTPALPFFAIAWAIPAASGLDILIEKLHHRPKIYYALTVFFSIVLLSGVAATVIKAGNIKRDKEMLEDVHSLKKVIPENAFISVTPDIMWDNWSFRCYMMRYNSISFSDKDTCNYFLGYPADKVATGFQKMDISLHLFSLYKRDKTVTVLVLLPSKDLVRRDVPPLQQ